MKRRVSDKDEFLKIIQMETDDIDDNFLLGYSEAILNMLGEFSDGECSQCPFSYEVETPAPDFIYPEIDLRCSLEECWTKTMIRVARKMRMPRPQSMFPGSKLAQIFR